MNEDMKNLIKSVDTIAQTTAKILERVDVIETTMATKDDLNAFKLETNTHFNNLETDLKSFKNETRDNFQEVNEKLDDINDTIMNHDKRIEALEEKAFA